MSEPVKVPQSVYDGLEVVRESGKTNMLDVSAVMDIALYLYEHETAAWVNNNRKLYAQGIFRGFEVSSYVNGT